MSDDEEGGDLVDLTGFDEEIPNEKSLVVVGGKEAGGAENEMKPVPVPGLCIKETEPGSLRMSEKYAGDAIQVYNTLVEQLTSTGNTFFTQPKTDIDSFCSVVRNGGGSIKSMEHLKKYVYVLVTVHKKLVFCECDFSHKYPDWRLHRYLSCKFVVFDICCLSLSVCI